MKKQLLKFFTLCTMALVADSVLAKSEYCDYHGEGFKQDGYEVTFTAGTDVNGDVIFTLGDYEEATLKTTNARFRAQCFEGESSGTNDKMRVVSESNGDEPASTYFDRVIADDFSYFKLKLKYGKSIPAGAKITFSGPAMAWQCDENNGRYSYPTISYTYGENCFTLNAPQITTFDNGVISFTSVDNATYYKAYVYLDSKLFHEQIIASGERINFGSYLDATYTVKVKAFNTTEESPFSNGESWEMEADPQYLPSSAYCEELMREKDAPIYFTWQTNDAGDVVITVSPVSGDAVARFRANAMGTDLSRFMVGDQQASTYFTKQHTQNDNTYTLHLTNPSNKPALGTLIYFTNQQVEYYTSHHDNEYPNMTFEYMYGTKCTIAPTSIVLASTATVAVNKHKQLEASVLPMLAPQTVTWSSNDETIAMVDENGKITGIAEGETVITATADDYPEVFATCTVTVTAAVILPNSEYCGKEMGKTEANGAAVLFTWETDDNGNIIITITEPDGSVTSNTHFRNNGVKVNKLKIGDVSLDTYFNNTVSGTSNIQTLTLKDPTNTPELGSKIVYTSGENVEYAVESNTNAWPVLSFEYTYGAVCSGKAVNAAVNDGTMGSAVAKQNGVEVTSVDPNTEVTFIATPKETYRFMNWTQNGVVVSDEAEYEVIVTDNITLTANFDYIRDTYCHSAVKATNVDKTLYLTLAATDTENEYMIRIEGSAEAPLTGITSAEFKINNITVDWSQTHTDVVFTAEHWTFDATGYGAATTTFALQEGKTLNDLHVWTRNIKFTSTAGNIEYTPGDDKFPNRYRIDWNTTCADDEAPVMDAPKADALNTTDIRLTLKATDNWEGPITYTISRDGAENIVVTAASGETKTYDVTDLATDATYTFSVVATDTKGNSCTAQECSVTLSAGGDVTAPTGVTVTARPMTDKSIELTLFANDDYDGDITYTITSAPSVSIDNVVAPRGTSTKTVVHTLAANTEYTFSVVATDAAGNAAAAVSTSATTFSGNLALNRPCEAGHETGNAGEAKGKSNDGDKASRWSSYGSINKGTLETEDWWSVQLDGVYDIANIRLSWQDARSDNMNVYTSMDGINWTLVNNFAFMPESSADGNTYTEYPLTNAQGRYIKVLSLHDSFNGTWGISFWEFEAYGTPAVDAEAPVITEFVANGTSATSILVRATATDNFGGDLTYTFYCDYVAIATPVVKAAGTEATYVFDNLENKEYTFKVVVSDGTDATTSEEVKASPANDTEAPTGLAVSNIVPEYNRVTFNLSATDDKGGMITYIVKNEGTQVATADALSGTTASIEVTNLNYLTAYTFTATAQDASGNTCEPINIEFTTATPPFPLEAAPAPRTYPEALVRSIYSDAFPYILAHDFLKTAWVNIGVEERTIDEDKFLFYTVTEVAHATAWGENGDGANAIIALDGYNDGTNKGVDVRQMNMLHVDLWSKVACQNVELRVCDALVATVQLDGTGWNSFDIDISSLSNDVKTNVRWVKFDRFTEANTFAIDNFFFYQKYDITLDETQDNATTISTNAGKYADVTINRAFDADGFNYTLCLPFDMTENQMQEAFGADYKLWKLDDAYMKSAEVLYLDFKEVRDLEAGVPYIFLPTETFEAGGIFSGVTVKSELLPVEIEVPSFGSVSMTGIYSPYTLPVENNYVLGGDNWLYQSDGEEMYGLRCYFTFGSAAPAGVRARAVFHNTDVVTDLETIDGSQCTMYDGKYVINGQFVIVREGKTYNAVGESINR